MAQVAHERLRYSQLASSYQDLQRSHAEVQANLEDYQELINAMEVQCEESDRERIRNEVELREARQEIAALRERVEAAGAKSVVGDNEHGEEATPSVKAALAKELKVQKRLLDDQSTTLLEKDREIQSLKRQLNAYQSMRRPSAAGVHRRLSSAGAQAAGNTSLRRQSIGSDASLSFMAAGSDAAQAPGDVSPEASHAEMVVDYVERFTERTRTAVDEKINELYSFASPAAARTPGHGKSLMDVPALDLNRTPTNMTVNNERPQSALTVNDLKQSVIQKSRYHGEEGQFLITVDYPYPFPSRSLLQQLASVQQALTRSQRVAHNVTQDFGPSAELQTSLFDILTELTENMDRAADTEREYERALFEKDGLIQKLQSKLRAMKEKVTVATGVTSMPATPNVKASTSSIWLGSLADLTHEDKMAAEATDAVIERNRELQGKVDELEGALEAVTNRLQAAEQMPPSETFQGALRELEKRINEKVREDGLRFCFRSHLTIYSFKVSR